MFPIHQNHFFKFLLTFLVIVGTLSCTTYYKYGSSNQTDAPFIPNSGANPAYNHYVIHSHNDMIEITDVRIDRESQKISGNPIPFEGLPLQYYQEIQQDKNQKDRRKTGADHGKAVRQIHLFVNDEGIHSEGNRIAIHFDDVKKVEQMKNNTLSNVLVSSLIATGGIVVGGAAFLAIACNCPHVYIDNQGQEELYTNLFTGAIAPQLERHDFKILPDYFENKNDFQLKIANEQEETQYTNLLELIAVYHGEYTKVLTDRAGNIYTISKEEKAISAFDNQGNSILEEIVDSDDQIFSFDQPNTDAGLNAAYLSFDNTHLENSGNLILKLRNPRWSGYVYNEFNALFGKKFDDWSEKNKDKSAAERLQWSKDQGINLMVDIKSDSGWESVDIVELVGEINFHEVLIPIENLSNKSVVDIRLRSGFKFWDLDKASMDFSKQEKIQIQRLKPLIASGNNGENFVASLSKDDGDYMYHSALTSFTDITFESAEIKEDQRRTLILHSKGYYTFNKTYEGKVHRIKLAKFKKPGSLSQFSEELYQSMTDSRE